MSDGGRTAERETRFAKLTVKLLLAAEVKQDKAVQWCEFQGYDYPLQLVSQIIARMVARIENDAREPFFLLASGAEHFVDDAWWEEFTAWYCEPEEYCEPEDFCCGDPDFGRARDCE